MPATRPRKVEMFERIAVHTLVCLYDEFPTPVDIKAATFGSGALPEIEGFDEMFELCADVARDSISFLIEEGFIRYEESYGVMGGPEFPQARLTMKGFTLLGKVPESIAESKDRRPFVEQLKSAVGEGAKGACTELVKSLFGVSIQMGVAAIKGI